MHPAAEEKLHQGILTSTVYFHGSGTKDLSRCYNDQLDYMEITEHLTHIIVNIKTINSTTEGYIPNCRIPQVW